MRVIPDPLMYKQVGIPGKFEHLLACIDSLRGRSHVAVPGEMRVLGNVNAASKFEHTLGVFHLALQVFRNKQFPDWVRLNLLMAALWHDFLSPPFTHIWEIVLRQFCGYNHEEAAQAALLDSEFGCEAKRLGGDLDIIGKFITGHEDLLPWCLLMNGPLDIDTLDALIRYAKSLGLVPPPDVQFYSPTTIVAAIRVIDQTICLDAAIKQQLDWLGNLRQAVYYKYIYAAPHLTPSAAILRALGLAAQHDGALPNDYCHMSDSRALAWLIHHPSPKVRDIVRLACAKEYRPIHEEVVCKPSLQLRMRLEDPATSNDLADHLQATLHLQPADITVYVGRNTAYRHQPIWLLNNTLEEYQLPGLTEQTWVVYAFASANVNIYPQAISEAVNEFFTISPQLAIAG